MKKRDENINIYNNNHNKGMTRKLIWTMSSLEYTEELK